MSFPLLIIACALVAATSFGEEPSPPRPSATPTATAPNIKSEQGFGAQLHLTEDQQFPQKWSQPKIPVLRTIERDEAHRGVPLLPIVLFGGPGLDANGSANVTYDFLVRKPDGSVYAEEKGVDGWKGKYPAPLRNLQMTQGGMGIRIEPQDPAGVYVVEITVHDYIKDVHLPLKANFKIAP